MHRIAVVIPAHNEEAHIAACLAAVSEAARRVASIESSRRHEVAVFVVCDACTDGTAEIVRDAGLTPLIVRERSVGAARAAGASAALQSVADWLAFTDADTLVTESWLVAQLTLESDVVCGTIAVEDWGAHGEAVRNDFAATYKDIDGHRHIHGANLGMSAAAYRRAGGFAMLTSSEDVAIVEALERAGATIAWSAAPRVVTSARVDHRAPHGFGAALVAAAERFRKLAAIEPTETRTTSFTFPPFISPPFISK